MKVDWVSVVEDEFVYLEFDLWVANEINRPDRFILRGDLI